MKIRKISILLAVSLAVIIAFTGCKKDDGAIPKRVSISELPTITTNIDATGSQSINLLSLASFSGKFKVDNYFPGATPPTKVDVVVRKWNGTANNNNVKVFKAGVTSLPVSYTITAAEIATLFGTAITLGDTYDFAPDIYVGDKKYEAFPAVGAGTGAGLNGQPFFGEFARFAAICAYDPDIYQGDFEVVLDEWADWSPGDIITLTKVSNSSFSFIDPFAVPPPASPAGVPIIVNVNTNTNVVTIPRISIGTKWVWSTTPNPPYNYTGAFISTNAGGTNVVAPCDKTVTFGLTIGVDQGNYTGPYKLVLKKKP